MSEFFDTEETDDPKAVAQFRKDMTAEIFDGKVPETEYVDPMDEKKTKESDDDVKSDDPGDDNSVDATSKDDAEISTEKESGVKKELPSELKEISKALNMLTSTVSVMENRLKQTESRIGGINNQLHEAKKVAKEVKSSPSSKQIDTAAKTIEGWQDLQRNFPEWADAFESKLATTREDLVSKEELEDLRKEMQHVSKNDMAIEERLVGIIHPNFRDIVRSTEYSEWLENQDAKIITKARIGKTAEEAIDVLNRFKAYQEAKNVPNDTVKKDKQKSRLEESVVVNKQSKSAKPILDEDMSEEEYRRKIAEELFNS